MIPEVLTSTSAKKYSARSLFLRQNFLTAHISFESFGDLCDNTYSQFFSLTGFGSNSRIGPKRAALLSLKALILLKTYETDKLIRKSIPI